MAVMKVAMKVVYLAVMSVGLMVYYLAAKMAD